MRSLIDKLPVYCAVEEAVALRIEQILFVLGLGTGTGG